MSFRRWAIGGVANCRLFSQASRLGKCLIQISFNAKRKGFLLVHCCTSKAFIGRFHFVAQRSRKLTIMKGQNNVTFFLFNVKFTSMLSLPKAPNSKQKKLPSFFTSKDRRTTSTIKQYCQRGHHHSSLYIGSKLFMPDTMPSFGPRRIYLLLPMFPANSGRNFTSSTSHVRFTAMTLYHMWRHII